MGEQVIVVGIGDVSSGIRAKNTLGSLGTYDKFARDNDVPFVMAYYYNENSKSRPEVNKYIAALLADIRMVWSSRVEGLDNTDLKHVLHYNKVSRYPAQLACLTRLGGGMDYDDRYGKVITVASVATSGNSIDFPTEEHVLNVPYQTDGTLDDAFKDVVGNHPVHFVVSEGLFGKLTQDINKRLDDLKQDEDSRIKSKPLTDSNSRVDADTGIVF